MQERDGNISSKRGKWRNTCWTETW